MTIKRCFARVSATLILLLSLMNFSSLFRPLHTVEIMITSDSPPCHESIVPARSSALLLTFPKCLFINST